MAKNQHTEHSSDDAKIPAISHIISQNSCNLFLAVNLIMTLINALILTFASLQFKLSNMSEIS